MASRTNRFIDGVFSGRVNPKDDYAVIDCKDPRAKRILEFLVPLLYPEKPTRVTITVGNTIFGALSGERPVDWGIVVKDLVQRLLSGMEKSKATPICPYVFHLYHSQELLLSTEKKEHWTKEALQKYNVESEREDDPESPANPEEDESSDDSECESLTPSEIREIQKQDAARLKKSPMNKRKQPPAPKEPVANKRKSPPPLEGPDRSYQVIAHTMKEIREREREQQGLIRAICARLRNVQPDGLLEAIDDLPSQKKLDELEAKSTFIHEKAKKVSDELKEEKEAHRKALDKLNLSLAFNQKLETYVGHTGDVVNKAQLFDANLAQNPVTAKKVIPVLVDFADKMEELLDEMRILFDGLQPEVPLVAAENLPDISGEIPSLIGWGKDRDSNKTGSTGTFRADTRGGSPIKTGTSPLTQNAHRRDLCASEGSASRIYRGRSSQGIRGRRESGLQRRDTSTNSPDRHHTDRTGRANGGTDEGVTNATIRLHSRAHLLGYSRVLGTPFLPQAAGNHHEDSLQDSGTRTHVPASDIITNTLESRHRYTRGPGSFR